MTDRRRFYLLGPDMRKNPSGFEFTNRDQALISGRLSGTRSVHVPGSLLTRSFGVPPLREKPALKVVSRLDIFGLSQHFVSSRAKALLERADPDGFEFAECSAVDTSGRELEPHWMLDVIRVVETIDEVRSDVVTYAERNPDAEDAGSNPLVSVLNDVYFPTVTPEMHAFHYVRYLPSFIVDSVIVDAWCDARLTGASFTPLQPPTEQERRMAQFFHISPYWNARS